MSYLTQLYKSKERKEKVYRESRASFFPIFCSHCSNIPRNPTGRTELEPFDPPTYLASLQKSCLVCCMLYAFHISKCPLSMKRIDTGWLKNHYKHTSKVPACHPSHLGIKTLTVIRNVRRFQVDHAIHQPKNVLLGSFGMIPLLPQPMTSW